MLDEYRIEQMGVGAYVDSIDEEVITVDQAVQRAFCWSNEMINNLIYTLPFCFQYVHSVLILLPVFSFLCSPF